MDAEFIGTEREGDNPYPIFRIMKEGHRLEGCTVVIDTLLMENLEIPTYKIEAMAPHRLVEIIKIKAAKEGVKFSEKAGYYILLGIESERKQGGHTNA